MAIYASLVNAVNTHHSKNQVVLFAAYCPFFVDSYMKVDMSVMEVSKDCGALIFHNQCLVHPAQPKDPTRAADNAIKPLSHNFRLQYGSLFSIFSQPPALNTVFGLLSSCRIVYVQVPVKTLTFIISPSGRERKWKTAFKFHWRHHFNLEVA